MLLCVKVDYISICLNGIICNYASDSNYITKEQTPMAKKFQITAIAAILIVFAILLWQVFSREQNPAIDVLQPLSQSVTAAHISAALLEAEETLLTAETFGRAPTFVGAEAMVICEKYVHAQILDAIYGWEFDLLIQYEIIDPGPPLEITWTLVETDAIKMNPRYFAPLTPRALTEDEIVTVRFYYHCILIDPYVMLLPDAYRYNAVEIPGPYLWAEFRRLMYEHTGISVWDLWFEGDKLYVDLHSTEEILFNWGSTGSFDRGTRLNKTVASLPGVASFEILVGGAHGVETSHYSFGVHKLNTGLPS